MVPNWHRKILEHLIITKDEDGHVHIHGPIANIDLMKEFVEAIAREVKKNQKPKIEFKDFAKTIKGEKNEQEAETKLPEETSEQSPVQTESDLSSVDRKES